MSAYGFFKGLLFPLFKVLFNYKTYGRENVPKEGGYIVSGNHVAYRDPVIIIYGTNQKVRYVAKSDLQRMAVFRLIFRIFRIIPIRRGESDRAALKCCCDTVKGGEILGIFPQGKRMPGVEISKEQSMAGVGFIAMNTKSAVLPVRLVYKNNVPKLFRKTVLLIGKPIPYEEYMSIEGGDPTRKQVSEYIFAKTCELSEEQFKNNKKA